MVFLSHDWVNALDEAMRAAAPARTAHAAPDPVVPELVIEYHVEQDSGPFVYHARFGATPGFAVGAAPSSTLVILTDRATAWAIAKGTQSAQAAFMAGQLRVEGDSMALLQNLQHLSALDDVFAGVTATTTIT